MIIREARRADSAEIGSLLGQLGYPAGEAAVARRLQALLADPAYELLVAVEDDRLVGLAALRVRRVLEHELPVGHVEALVVDEGSQRRGVGTGLARALESEARSRGCSSLFLTSAARRRDAHGFYRHLGYEQTGVRFTKAL